jgi:flagellar biosynthesis regulator FlbT
MDNEKGERNFPKLKGNGNNPLFYLHFDLINSFSNPLNHKIMQSCYKTTFGAQALLDAKELLEKGHRFSAISLLKGLYPDEDIRFTYANPSIWEQGDEVCVVFK